MTNGGIIEGHTEYSGCSDLSRAIGYAGQHNNTAHYLPTLNRADVNWAWSGGGYCRRNHGNPYAEKEARLRPQHHYSFGSGETRMKMRSQQWFGGIVVGAPPRS